MAIQKRRSQVVSNAVEVARMSLRSYGAALVRAEAAGDEQTMAACQRLIAIVEAASGLTLAEALA